MIKVYVLFEIVPNENSYLRGVFSARLMADQAALDLQNDYDRFEVTEINLDEILNHIFS